MDCLIRFCDKIKYIFSEKCGIADSIDHNFGEIRIDSYNHLHIGEIILYPALK